MRASLAVLLFLVFSLFPNMSTANVFDLGTGLTSLETVPVGNPGNQPDARYGGYGSVGYEFRMGKYEITAAQYTAFLNAVAATDTYGLYSTYMGDLSWLGCNIAQSGVPGSYTYSVASDWANRPVNYVSYWNACRFANWLHNGQPTGLQSLSTTEDGAYFVNGYTLYDGRTIQRKPGARWFLPSEDEWYKAAYYDPAKLGGAGNWDYPTKSDVIPSNVLGSPTDPGNNATFYSSGYTIGTPYRRTEVGDHENSESAYGTFDQGGNVWEWNEAIYQDSAFSMRGNRGGGFNYDANCLSASVRSGALPGGVGSNVGFRVASAIPEPSSLLAFGCGLLALAGMTWRRR